MSKDPSAKSKQSPKVPAKPRQKKETKALTALPVTVAAEKDPLGPEWYNDDDVQNLLPTEDRKRSKNQNPKAEEKRGMLNLLIAGLVGNIKLYSQRLRIETDEAIRSRIQERMQNKQKEKDELERDLFDLDAPIKLLVVQVEVAGACLPSREPEKLKRGKEKAKELGRTPQERRYRMILFVHGEKGADQDEIAVKLQAKFGGLKVSQSCISKYSTAAYLAKAKEDCDNKKPSGRGAPPSDPVLEKKLLEK